MIREASERTLWETPLQHVEQDVSSTAVRIAERNRRNAQRSTGPRSEAGKERARRNSMKHGLCANPAAGVVEEPGRFHVLHEALVDRFQPRDEIEAGLVHRIAVSLWRLQRAATADAAATELAVRAVVPQREQVQRWIEGVQDAWRVETVAEFDPELRRQQQEDGKRSVIR
ncbi:MAG: hypothetical protein WD294_07420 [Phycisphaeraceae bacterium]